MCLILVQAEFIKNGVLNPFSFVVIYKVFYLFWGFYLI